MLYLILYDKVVTVGIILSIYVLCRQEKSSDPDSIEVNPLKIFYTAIENSKPTIGCQTVKKGGKNYQVSSKCLVCFVYFLCFFFISQVKSAN